MSESIDMDYQSCVSCLLDLLSFTTCQHLTLTGEIRTGCLGQSSVRSGLGEIRTGCLGQSSVRSGLGEIRTG